MRVVGQSSKIANVCYEIRGPVLDEARRLEDAGEHIIKLNIGNPGPFGFEAPANILRDMIHALPMAHGYSDSKGIMPARLAVAQYFENKGVVGVGPDDIYLGNGVSELIVMAMQGLLENGDEVLIPAPDYPLWTAATSLAGGRPVHYLCDESAGWEPDLADLEAKISPATRAIVVINPNNPTGALYGNRVLLEIAELARKYDLIVMADEIYDRVLYDGAVHTSFAALAPDLLVLTFNGLSKTHRVAGFRSGWLGLSGPKDHAAGYIEALTVLANMRLCANVPAQYAIQTALGGKQSIEELTRPGGRLDVQRRRACELLNAIPGVSCVEPQGALYVFPRLDAQMYPIENDEQFALSLLRRHKVLIVQGTGFNWPNTDHFRIVTLPHVGELEVAIGRLGEFLDEIRCD